MFRFTIRELVLLTLIAAMGAAWWVDRSRLSARVAFLEEGAELLMAYLDTDSSGHVRINIRGKSWPHPAK